MNFLHEEGVGLTEYALILSLAVIVVVAALTAFGSQLGAAYSRIIASFPSL